MDKVHHFFLLFIESETRAKTNRRTPDIATYNNSLTVMDSFLSDILKTRFGLSYKLEPDSPEYYEEAKLMDPVENRLLFRIDKVENDEYGTLYKAFCNNPGGTKSYFQCLLARPEGNSFQIISRYTWGIGRDGSDAEHWYISGGEKIPFADLQPVTETLRLLAPEDDEASMQQYES